MKGRHNLVRLIGALLIALIVVVTLFGSVRVEARSLGATFMVTNTNDSGAGSLRQAILNANATAGADVINITATGTVDLLSALPSVAETVTIQGPGASLFVVDGQNLYRPLELDNDSMTVSDLTVQRGNAGLFGTGGGIRSFGPLTLTNVIVMSNTAQLVGGGIDAHDALALNDVQVLSNATNFAGGGVNAIGPVTMNGGLFQNNACVATNCNGGGAYISNTLSLVGTTFINNTAVRKGGGADVADTATLNGGLFQDNRCTDVGCLGGALDVNNTLALTETQFIGNSADLFGGGVEANGDATLNGGLFQNNRCSHIYCGGGALTAWNALALTGTQFISNSTGGVGGGVEVQGAAVLNNGLFQNNYCTSTSCLGGGLYGNGTLTSTGTQFISNTATEGGGIYLDAELILSQTRFISNTATTGSGGGVLLNGSLTLSETQFVANQASGGGGGAWVNGDEVLNNGLFQNNHCGDMTCSGGGLRANGGLTATASLFISNTANSQGGGVYAFGSTSLSETQFINNWSIDSGGGVYANDNVVLNGGLFQNNRCLDLTCFGGGLYTTSTLTLSGTDFIGNTAGGASDLDAALAKSIARPTGVDAGGGGAAARDAVTLTAGVFQDNRCLNACWGGGLYTRGTLTLSGTQFISNTAVAKGAGAVANGDATLTGGVFLNNRCTGVDCSGGGLVAGHLTLTGTQFLNNSAAMGGGLSLDGGSGILVNALLARNTATLSGTALALWPSGDVQIYHATIGSDTPVSSTAIYVGLGSVNLFDTIIADHSIGVETGGTHVTVTQDFNLFYNDGIPWTGAVTGGAHNASGNPKFVNVTLDDYHLDPGSAAIDAGTDVGVMTDVDGDARPKGNGFDIGYDEFTQWLIDLPLISK